MSKKIIGIVVALVVVLVLGVVSFFPKDNQTTNNVTPQSGGVRPNSDSYPYGFSLGGLSQNYGVAPIIASRNYTTWKNTTGRTVYVDFATLNTSGIASSSMRVSIGTTTSAVSTSDYASPFATLVDNFLLATSTAIRSINSIIDNGTNGRGVIPVLDGQSVFFLIRQDQATTQCTGATCESATSTNRGFNATGIVHYFQ